LALPTSVMLPALNTVMWPRPFIWNVDVDANDNVRPPRSKSQPTRQELPGHWLFSVQVAPAFAPARHVPLVTSMFCVTLTPLAVQVPQATPPQAPHRTVAVFPVGFVGSQVLAVASAWVADASNPTHMA